VACMVASMHTLRVMQAMSLLSTSGRTSSISHALIMHHPARQRRFFALSRFFLPILLPFFLRGGPAESKQRRLFDLA
jgi:hypothetical protein